MLLHLVVPSCCWCCECTDCEEAPGIRPASGCCRMAGCSRYSSFVWPDLNSFVRDCCSMPICSCSAAWASALAASFCLLCGLPFAFGRQGGNAVDGFLKTFLVGSGFFISLYQRELADSILHKAFSLGGLVFQIFHIPQGTQEGIFASLDFLILSCRDSIFFCLFLGFCFFLWPFGPHTGRWYPASRG